ncbi:MAG: hypothetical protein V2A79_05175 [Planctomycetota bacterium]
MKHGTLYAKRMKRLYARVRRETEDPQVGAPTEPLEQLVLSALGQETSLPQAHKAVGRLLEVMVDLNEIRVSSPREIADILDAYLPNGRACATRLCQVLNAVFNSRNALNLNTLLTMGKREAKHWLEKLNGIEPYQVASVMLWSLGGHAVPVNARLLAALCQEELVDPHASVAEVQSFLERHTSPAEAKAFCLLMEGFASRKGTCRSKSASATTEKKATTSTPPSTAGRTKTVRRKKTAPEKS